MRVALKSSMLHFAFLTMALGCLAVPFTELLHGLVAPSELVSAVETAAESYCADGLWKWVLQGSEGQSELAEYV